MTTSAFARYGSIARHALTRLCVDDNGFDVMDRLLLDTLVNKFYAGPSGVETRASPQRVAA